MHVVHHLLGSHSVALFARSVLVTICLSSVTYYGFAILSAKEFFSAVRSRNPHFQPPITILKPLRGIDRDAYENFASFCRQRYPKYQLIFGADSPDEPAIGVARQIARDFPNVDIRVVIGGAPTARNPKVGNLTAMVSQAKYPTILISDSDIRVGPGHLETIIAPMADPRVGVVTCLYRSEATGFAGTMDALGLSTDFQPSVLVARKVEGISFAMGSAILIRRSVLEEVGGFPAVADYLADDYLLGNLPARAGYQVELSPYVVDHRLDTASLRQFIQHQIRWNRGIRAARPWGYAGLVLTQGVPASLLLLLVTGGSSIGWGLAGLTLAARLGMAWFIAVRCLKDRAARSALWLVPVRDVLSFAMWVSAFFGATVVWRGNRFRIGEGGRLLATPTASAGPTAARTRVAS
jgi:ceramide glucosyltransferase